MIFVEKREFNLLNAYKYLVIIYNIYSYVEIFRLLYISYIIYIYNKNIRRNKNI